MKARPAKQAAKAKTTTTASKAKKAKAPKKDQTLRYIGIWATLWWAVSCVYVLLVVWAAKDYYAANATTGSLSWHDWQQAISQATQDHTSLLRVLFIIMLGWFVGGHLWLKALKANNMSYKEGLKDLFLTLR